MKEREKIVKSLRNIDGMIDVDEKTNEIEEQLQSVVDNDENIKLVNSKADEILRSLPRQEEKERNEKVEDSVN
jgi:hypothetical protein